jgi:uncharacterized membrane protein
MMIYGAAYLASLALFVVADMVWLGAMASRLYRPTLGDIALSNVNLAPATAFYIFYPLGLLIFAVLPALKSGSVSVALLYGALFGFFTYATYDLTNQATLRNWTFRLTLIDVAWGTTLAAASAAAGYWIAGKFGP